jgi:hypothetical protein
MARSRITATSDDLVSDSGSVLWSFVLGEQLEFPLVLNFVEDATAGYTYEAVVIEADNIQDSDDTPVSVKIGGVQTRLNVRIPENRGNWDAPQAYNREDVVKHNLKYYKLLRGVARTSATTPDLDPLWEETTLGTIYLQFPKTLGLDWGVTPSVTAPVYGFFELRVTEPNDSIFQRTWKPIRGMVQILFSPTELVSD